MKKTTFLVFVLALLLVSSNVAHAYTNSGEQLWDKGRYHTHYVSDSNIGQSAGIISVSSYYSPTGEWGMNRLRIWSRTPAVDRHLDSLLAAKGVAWVNSVEFTQEALDAASTYTVYKTNPVASGWSNAYLEGVIYDILGYKGVPTSTLQAIVNDLTTKVAVSENTAGTSNTVELKNPNYARDLPEGIHYDDADGAVAGNLSGYQAKFWYNLASANTQFHLAARGKITYSYQYTFLNDVYYYTFPTKVFSRGFYVNNS